MQCPTCSHEAPAAAFGEPLRCPECGAYYEKALALKLRKESGAPAAQPGKGATVGGVLLKVDGALRSAADVVTPKAPSMPRGVVGKFYCPACGQTGNGVRHVPGSILIELVLWLCFLVPGIIYSIWRHAASKKACHVCRTAELIPVNSPRARRELGIG